LDINYVRELLCFPRHFSDSIRAAEVFGRSQCDSAPQSNAAEAIRISSVAMTTRSKFLARRQRSQPFQKRLSINGYSGFPGNRVESHRAGIIPTALLMREIDGHDRWSKMICAAAGKSLASNPQRCQ
jgi:hypothetical protein